MSNETYTFPEPSVSAMRNLLGYLWDMVIIIAIVAGLLSLIIASMLYVLPQSVVHGIKSFWWTEKTCLREILKEISKGKR